MSNPVGRPPPKGPTIAAHARQPLTSDGVSRGDRNRATGGMFQLSRSEKAMAESQLAEARTGTSNRTYRAEPHTVRPAFGTSPNEWGTPAQSLLRLGFGGRAALQRGAPPRMDRYRREGTAGLTAGTRLPARFEPAADLWRIPGTVPLSPPVYGKHTIDVVCFWAYHSAGRDFTRSRSRLRFPC
jgi:hypothetical protein